MYELRQLRLDIIEEFARFGPVSSVQFANQLEDAQGFTTRVPISDLAQRQADWTAIRAWESLAEKSRRVTRLCLHCQKDITTARADARFCGKWCRSEARAGRPYLPSKERDCARCGRRYTPKRADGLNCSPTCRPPIPPRPCAYCGKPYTPSKREGSSYCSANCGQKARREGVGLRK